MLFREISDVYSKNLKEDVTVLNNYALCHEDIWGGGMAPRILDLGTRCECMVNFTPPPLTTGESTLITHWMSGWVGAITDLNSI
jgi:hypothetical protein